MATGYTPADPEYRRVSWSFFLAGGATFTTIYATQALLPDLARDFAITPAHAAGSVSITTITLGLALIFVGPLSDAVGRVRIVKASLVISALVSLSTAFVTDWTHMMVLRGVLGLVVAGLPAVAAAYLREELDFAYAARATGLYIGGNAIGGMTGRLVTGILSGFWGWRGSLLAVSALALACAIGVLILLPDSRRFVASPLRVADLNANARRMMEPGLLRLYAIGFCTLGVQAAIFNAITFRLVAPPFQLPVALMSLLFLTYALGSFSSTYAGRITGRVGARTVVPIALGIQAVGVLVTIPDNLVCVIIGVALNVIGFFAAHGVASSWVAARASAIGPGTAQAGSFYLFAYYLGSSALGAAAGAAWSTYGWNGVAIMCLVTVAVGIALALSMRGVPNLGQVDGSAHPHH